MKRSELNKIMAESVIFFEQNKFLLPPFAKWQVKDWNTKGEESSSIVKQMLGWDITDFGSGDFEQVGLIIFTIRNAEFSELSNPLGKHYAEKALIVLEEQVTPMHFHYQKMEDIINRGGGVLVMQFWHSNNNEPIDKPIELYFDGVRRIVNAGEEVYLYPGESVCIPQLVYHKFWGQKGTGKILLGEVSRVNNDYEDNYFYTPIGRFPELEEDEHPLYLLYNDYKNYYPIYSKMK